MSDPQSEYRHLKPQRNLNHTVKPATERPAMCATCHKPIRVAKPNEGPESLMALFTF